MQKIDRLDRVRPIEIKTEQEAFLSETKSGDIGRLLLRFSIGILLLMHGMHKVLHGNEFVGEAVHSVGLPSFIASGVFIGEVVAPIMLILGFKVRLAAFLVALNMLAAVILVHVNEITQVSQTGGWMIELDALYLFGAIAIMLLGSGHYAVSKGKGILD